MIKVDPQFTIDTAVLLSNMFISPLSLVSSYHASTIRGFCFKIRKNSPMIQNT